MLLSLICLLIAFPAGMTTFLHYLTLLELYALSNVETFYPIAGVVWVSTLSMFLSAHLRKRVGIGKFWVVHEKFLDEIHGRSDASTTDQKPLIVREVPSENLND
jgi:hypothetical protein